MSVTKFENVEGELISQADTDSVKFSVKSSRCSCINCDSISCFEKRKKAVKDRCQCGICKEIRKSSTSSNKDSRAIKKDPDSATRKIIREVVTRETIESLKRVTETMYEFDANENFGMITAKQSNVNDNKVMPTRKKSQMSNTLTCCKKISIGDNEICDKNESCTQRAIVQNSSTDASIQHKAGNTVIKLSAQVMNVPYEDLHESVPSSHELTEQNPLSKLNIFKRIKEIYEACSCKVCECISSKPRDLQGDICKCKPCQCQDCMKLRKKIEEKIKRIPHSGCPCIRCDRKDCRGITKNTYEPQACDCDPNESIRYPENLTKLCKCEPCQCINCRLNFRTPKTVKLGQVDEIIHRETCQCFPCECIECKQIYSRTNPTIMCTHSNIMGKYRNFCRCSHCTEPCKFDEIETCKCMRQNRATRKSFDKNCNDYDIRTVIVDNNSPFSQQDECNFEKHDTVALFSSSKNNFPSNSCNKGICKCTECECIVCSARDNSLRSYRENLKHNVMSLHNAIKLPTSIADACKCTPCECEICSKAGACDDNIVFENKCKCDVCDCVNCDSPSFATSSLPASSITPYNINVNPPIKPIRSVNMNKNCGCNPCDCSNCKKLFSCSSSIKFYSNGKSVERKTTRKRKVMLITPSTSESRFKSQKTYVGTVSSTTLSPKNSVEGVFGLDLSTCHAISQNCVPISRLTNANKDPVFQLYRDGDAHKIISDDAIDRQIFFKYSYPVLDTESFKSLQETPILNYACNPTETTFKTYKIENRSPDPPSETNCRSNKIHEQPVKITSNKFEESLPMSWSNSIKKSYPGSISDNLKMMCKQIGFNHKDGLNDNLNKIQNPKHEQNELIEAPVKKSTNIQSLNLRQQLCKHSDSSSSISGIDDLEIYKKPTVNHSEVTIDYERATRVLWEAKAFSSKLIKMLDSFETANRQFESASQKFKVLHESLLDINENELNKNYNTKLDKVHNFENTFKILPDDYQESRQSNNKSEKNENEAEREYEKCTAEAKDVSDKYEIYDTSEIQCANESIEEKDDIISQQNEADTLNDITMTSKSNPQSQGGKANSNVEISFTESSLQINQTVVNNEANEINDENAQNVTQAPMIGSVMKKLDSVFGDVTFTDATVVTDNLEKDLVETKQEDKQPFQIFKKNLYLNAWPNFKRSIYQSSALELDIKEAIQAISLQSTNENYTKVLRKPNRALANLQNEVNDLLNMPLLQTSSEYKCKTKPDVNLFSRRKLDLEVKSMSSTASSQTYSRIIEQADKEVYFNNSSETHKVSCEQLKANFIGLRRVSDHTVLVKWDVPERIKDVQGYELLVDGRAVQKIFSPTRSMAVVTCLPHAARILLTIRTIATADCGHAPTSSIVYRPRTK